MRRDLQVKLCDPRCVSKCMITEMTNSRNEFHHPVVVLRPRPRGGRIRRRIVSAEDGDLDFT